MSTPPPSSLCGTPRMLWASVLLMTSSSGEVSLFCLQCQIVRSGRFRFQGPMFLLDSLDHGLPLMRLKDPKLIQHFASPASSTPFTTNSLTVSHAPTWPQLRHDSPVCLGPPPCLFLLSPCSPPCSLSPCSPSCSPSCLPPCSPPFFPRSLADHAQRFDP